MSKKIAVFSFNGHATCFTHALLNTKDLNDKGFDVKLIIEGETTKLVKDLADPDVPYSKFYTDVRDAGLIDCVCRACASKMGALESAEEQGLRLSGGLAGHPAMSEYLSEGYEIIVI